MSDADAAWRDAARAFAARHRDALAAPLDTPLPRLVAYTREDKAAKGLRSLRERRDAPEPPLHFTALEMLQDERALLLTAPAGGGRTTLALQIGLAFAAALSGDAPGAAAAPPVRNDRGDAAPERWTLGPVLPALVNALPGMTLGRIVDAAGDAFGAALRAGEAGPLPILIVDDAEALRDGWPDVAADLPGMLTAHPRLRLLFLGEARETGGWRLPGGLARHALTGLPVAQRRQAQASSGRPPASDPALSPAAAHPGIFAMARQIGPIGAAASAEDIVDAWLARAAPGAPAPLAWLAPLADAARLARRGDPAPAVARFAADPAGAGPLIESLLSRWRHDVARTVALVGALLDLPGDGARRAALCVAGHADRLAGLRSRIGDVLLDTVQTGALRPAERIAAGRALSILGDPRDLEILADIPGGAFTMGCASNPNSAPPHRVVVGSFRIGAYPVTNARYAAFVRATGRRWTSPDGTGPDRANMPATDLTWHDARAFCAWLTTNWRREGRIAGDRSVRLPTEPEWERAARGDQPAPADGVVHPWGLGWDDDRVNGETTGANDVCAVGLFPRGRSPYGCFDMAGQVWEWCQTLWGEDMARPSFAYPYRDDGREVAGAPDAVRRVLRGGCFSSGPAKANVSYRGSLEAGGFWRGNGFRIVVARDA
jgi:iron(II)-dependent oxidoreductase